MKEEIEEQKEETAVEQKDNVTTEFEEVKAYQEVEPIKKVVRTDSYFDGGLIELIGWKILGFLVTLVTFGICAPWAKCMIYSYQIKHTVYNGKRLKFEGTGGDLFVNTFKWVLLSIITFGIYGFLIPVRKTRWVISNIHFEDEDLITNESFFDGKTIQLIGINLLCNFLNIITLGMLSPFTTCYKLRWINKHTVINRKKLVFNGKAIGLWGKNILWYFLTTITFGIYGLWLPIKMLKWQTKHTHIKTVGEEEQKDKSFLFAIPIAIIVITIVCSMAIPFFANMIKNVDFEKGFDFEEIFSPSGAGRDFMTESAVSSVAGSKVNSANSKNNASSSSSSKNNNKTSSSTTSKKNTSTTTSSSSKNNNKTTTSSGSNSSSSTVTKRKYPALTEIPGEYGMNITVKKDGETMPASGIEDILVSGGKVKFYEYSMKYDASTGYAYYTSSTAVAEAYFTYKGNKVHVEMRIENYNTGEEKYVSGTKI